MMALPADPPLRILVWNEGQHERLEEDVRARYPTGIHGAIADGLRQHLGGIAEVRTATLDEPQHGLTEEALDSTDVLCWWGHIAHNKVDDTVVERVRRHVLAGMGLVVLHSGHLSKIFVALMGTSCTLQWRAGPDRELVWTIDPAHPIAVGVPHPLVLDQQEMYGEHFDIPAPDELVFISSFSCGEVFRSGCTFRRGRGRIFYFSPGDQKYPVYHEANIRRVLANGVRWAAATT
ncbi:ThuA domain-containing protein [Pseudonocardia nigra]|uniref:ThuA domain-containing protein n=1 Tax=Pseudonocardia nigra TaxID=1921578 RepID=UPI001C6053DD|nr:ThuA domain-containing protein [Pseudonocardia nigra]